MKYRIIEYKVNKSDRDLKLTSIDFVDKLYIFTLKTDKFNELKNTFNKYIDQVKNKFNTLRLYINFEYEKLNNVEIYFRLTYDLNTDKFYCEYSDFNSLFGNKEIHELDNKFKESNKEELVDFLLKYSKEQSEGTNNLLEYKTGDERTYSKEELKVIFKIHNIIMYSQRFYDDLCDTSIYNDLEVHINDCEIIELKFSDEYDEEFEPNGDKIGSYIDSILHLKIGQLEFGVYIVEHIYKDSDNRFLFELYNYWISSNYEEVFRLFTNLPDEVEKSIGHKNLDKYLENLIPLKLWKYAN